MGRKKKPSKLNLVVRGVLIVLGIIMSTYALAFLPSQVQAQLQTEAKEMQSRINELQSETNPYFIDMSKIFICHLGKHGFNLTATPEAIAKGFQVINDNINFGGGLPLEIKIHNNRLLISANVTDAKNEVIGEIQDNIWKDTTSQSLLTLCDKNSNNFAFEVVYKNKMPLLQIYFMGTNEIDITGFFHSSSGDLIVATDDVLTMNPQENLTLEPLFLYPSINHPSELAHPERFLPPDDSIPLSTWMNYSVFILAVAGSSLTVITSIDYYWKYK